MGWGKERREVAASLRSRLSLLKRSLGCARHGVTMVGKMAFPKLMIWGWRQTLNKSSYHELCEDSANRAVWRKVSS